MKNCVKLNLPQFDIKTRSKGSKDEIWDYIRMRWLVMTPEEWVRQNFIRYIVEYKNISPMLIKQEMSLNLNGTQKRADIVVYTNETKPLMLVECKAPHIKITEETLQQVARYNMVLKLPYLVVTNGLVHYYFRYDIEKNITSITDKLF